MFIYRIVSYRVIFHYDFTASIHHANSREKVVHGRAIPDGDLGRVIYRDTITVIAGRGASRNVNVRAID